METKPPRAVLKLLRDVARHVDEFPPAELRALADEQINVTLTATKYAMRGSLESTRRCVQTLQLVTLLPGLNLHFMLHIHAFSEFPKFCTVHVPQDLPPARALQM